VDTVPDNIIGSADSTDYTFKSNPVGLTVPGTYYVIVSAADEAGKICVGLPGEIEPVERSCGPQSYVKLVISPAPSPTPTPSVSPSPTPSPVVVDNYTSVCKTTPKLTDDPANYNKVLALISAYFNQGQNFFSTVNLTSPDPSFKTNIDFNCDGSINTIDYSNMIKFIQTNATN
jgi:hypothetical protein